MCECWVAPVLVSESLFAPAQLGDGTLALSSRMGHEVSRVDQSEFQAFWLSDSWLESPKSLKRPRSSSHRDEFRTASLAFRT